MTDKSITMFHAAQLRRLASRLVMANQTWACFHSSLPMAVHHPQLFIHAQFQLELSHHHRQLTHSVLLTFA